MSIPECFPQMNSTVTLHQYLLNTDIKQTRLIK